MKIYIMTDLEGVAGVANFHDWASHGQPYYETAKEFVTQEVNAAVDGFFEGGATEILVADGHGGGGGINIRLLDPRVEYLRGWQTGPYPLCLDETFDAAAWVGQHAKAGTEYGHLAHTQGPGVLDLSVNGVSIGEFGQLALCASELGVRSIFGSGDHAFTQEARDLVPGIETVAVKRGVRSGTGDDLPQEEYLSYTSAARHLHPVRARRLIREGALRAIKRARTEEFGIVPLSPPFERVCRQRPNADRAYRTISRATHPTSVIAVMNASAEAEPLNE
jgi:D-amino peptidase